jgi:hypothetical protein
LKELRNNLKTAELINRISNEMKKDRPSLV